MPPTRNPLKGTLVDLFVAVGMAALRWELIQPNPTNLVQQSKMRFRKPTVLSPEEFGDLLTELMEPFGTMGLTVACLGLRACELLSLQWKDLDFEHLAIRVERSVSEGEINHTKNRSSEDTLPLDPDLAESLLMHKRRFTYTGDSGYFFASPVTSQPRWPDTIREKVPHPAARRAGISKRAGRHSLRHTYSSPLHSLVTSVIVQKELLRHADVQTTMNIYTQLVGKDKREAQLKVAELLKKGKAS